MTFAQLLSTLSIVSFLVRRTDAAQFDPSRSDNVATYWGTHLYNLSDICQDPSIDAIPIAFMSQYPPSDPSSAGLVIVTDDSNCENTGQCDSLAPTIQACQNNGKIVTISIGGEGGNIQLPSEQAAQEFGEWIYNTYLGGNSSTRPFGSAILDGFDLDLEGGGSAYFSTFINHTMAYAKQNNDEKKYYVTAAPQCPYPDAHLGEVLGDAAFDAVYVQFYNNYCSVGPSFNFYQWDEWARNNAINKDVKVYLGAPASSAAAGSGYVDAATLAQYVQSAQKNYTTFGGVMLWDATFAAENNDYAGAVKQMLTAGSGNSSSSSNKPPSSSTGSNNTVTASATSMMNTTASVTGTMTDAGASSQTQSLTHTASSADASQTGDNGCPVDSGESGSDSDSDSGSEDEGDGPLSSSWMPTGTSTGFVTSKSGSKSALAAPSGTSGGCAVPPSASAAVDCSNVEPWSKVQQYNGCDEVVYNGTLWQAKSWVTSNEPGTIDVWIPVGSCGSSTANMTGGTSATGASEAPSETTATISSSTSTSVFGSPTEEADALRERGFPRLPRAGIARHI